MGTISWLTYTQTILEKVSFDPALFLKELRKGMAKLSIEEIIKLEEWSFKKLDLKLSLEVVNITQKKLA